MSETPPRRTRWLDRLSMLFVLAGAAGAVAAAAPPILRATGVEVPAPFMMGNPVGVPQTPPVLAPGHAPAPPSVTSAPPAPPRASNYAFDEHPRFAPESDEPHITELERMYPDGMWPRYHGPESRPGRDDADVPVEPRLGLARGALALHPRPDANTTPSGQVPAGGRVVLLREVGEWAEVLVEKPGGTVVGWAERKKIAIP